MRSIKKLCSLVLTLLLLCSFAVAASAETVEEYDLVSSITLDGRRNDGNDGNPQGAGWSGMRITVGAKDLYLTQIGRIYEAGTAAMHNVLVVDASDDSIVAEGIRLATPAKAEEGKFFYGDVTDKKIVLKAGKAYYIVADFQGAGDPWYDNAKAETAPDASIDGAVMLDLATGGWIFTEQAGIGYGPMDLKYTLEEGEVAADPNAPALITETRTIDEILATEEISDYVDTFSIAGDRNLTPGDAANYAGWVGIRVTTGEEAIIVTALGRMNAPASEPTHNMIIIDAETNAVVIDSISVTGEKAGEFAYTNLPYPVVLQPNHSYYIATDVLSWTDQWYDSTAVVTTGSAVLDGVVIMGLSNWEFYEIPVSWGPVSFRYVKTEQTGSEETPAPTEMPQTTPTDLSATESNSTGLPVWAIILIVAGAAVLIAAVIIVIVKKKKQ